jgi:hypothetical protein
MCSLSPLGRANLLQNIFSSLDSAFHEDSQLGFLGRVREQYDCPLMSPGFLPSANRPLNDGHVQVAPASWDNGFLRDFTGV